MKVILLLALALAMVTIFVVSDEIVGKGTAKGIFKYKDDNCKWHEKMEARSIRSLNIKCGNTFSTKYEGDPHKCNWYKDGNQVAYYECLVSALIKDNFDSNSPSLVTCTKKNCGDVVFKKVSSHLLKVIMKKMNVEQGMVEIEEHECDKFDAITGFD